MTCSSIQIKACHNVLATNYTNLRELLERPNDRDIVVVGEYIADFVIDGKIIIEVKAVSNLTSSHQAQALNYLAATGYQLAILINFGATSLQQRRVVR